MIARSKIVVFGIVSILIATMALASFALSNIRRLSIPISQVLGLLTIVLPAVASASLYGTRRLLLESQNGNRPSFSLPLLALIVSQIIYETIIGTISLTHIVSGSVQDCALSEQWQSLFLRKDGQSIRTIQDNFNCCGFNSVRDRAWPFASNTPSSCAKTFGRSQSCLLPWKKAERVNAAYIFLIVICVFVVKSVTIVSILTKRSGVNQKYLAYVDDEGEEEQRNNMGRLLIKDNNSNKAFREAHYEDAESYAQESHAQGSKDAVPTTVNALIDAGENEWLNEGTTR